MSPHEKLKKHTITTGEDCSKKNWELNLGVCDCEPGWKRWKVVCTVPALVAAGQTGLPATEEAVFWALLLAAGGSLDWR